MRSEDRKAKVSKRVHCDFVQELKTQEADTVNMVRNGISLFTYRFDEISFTGDAIVDLQIAQQLTRRSVPEL